VMMAVQMPASGLSLEAMVNAMASGSADDTDRQARARILENWLLSVPGRHQAGRKRSEVRGQVHRQAISSIKTSAVAG
jgi:hypothetical protein